MKPKTVLVPIFDVKGSDPAVRAACELASRHDATVVGLFVVDISTVAGFGIADMPPQAFTIERERILADAAQAEKTFMAMCDERGIDADWRCEEGGTHSVVDQYARHSDLVCLDVRREGGGAEVADDFIFSTGRPVLVVPPTYSDASIGHRVAVAWNASRESARAQADAMGILREATSVSLVTVVDPSMSDREAGVNEVDSGRFLARHGVELETFTIHRGSTSVGEALHEWLREHEIDLLVMGAYGHSRLRETVLGGVTRWMLRNATLPVFMSH